MSAVISENWSDLRNRSYASHLAVPEIFSAEECKDIISQLSEYETQAGQVRDGDTFAVMPELRQLQTAYVKRTTETEWIYERMDLLFHTASEFFGIEVKETREDLKFLIYRSGSHFAKWHSDNGEEYANLRKLSMSIELNDSFEYQGGDFQVFPDQDVPTAGADRKAGTAIVFPSHRYHRVTPVTMGIRYALVNWISGPPLR